MGYLDFLLYTESSLKRVSNVDLCFLNTDCSGHKILFFSRNHISLCFAILSKTLHMQLVNVIELLGGLILQELLNSLFIIEIMMSSGPGVVSGIQSCQQQIASTVPDVPPRNISFEIMHTKNSFFFIKSIIFHRFQPNIRHYLPRNEIYLP